MKDVALHAGVSVSTVSYVLNNSGPVATPRRARVLDAVRVLNYTPNESARSLKRRSTSAIGLIVPDLTNQFFALITEGVERAATERDVLIVLCAPDATGRGDPDHARLLQSQRLDGVIYLAGARTSPEVILELSKSGAVVLVDEQLPGFDLPTVVADSRRGAREVARYVVEQGHTQLAIIGGPQVLWTADQRLSGMREALAAAGIDSDTVPVYVGDYREESGRRLAEEALSGTRGSRPTAVLCANDMMAIGVIQYCRSAGIRVPEDVSVTGFDDVPVSAMISPALTTVSQPARDMGYAAATLLFDRLAGTADGDGTIMFPTSLCVRESVRPPAQ